MQKYLPVFERLIFWLILFLFFFIPLYFKFPLFSFKETFVSIRLEDIVIAFIYLLFGAYLYFSKTYKIIIKDKLFLSIIVFYFVGLVSLLSSAFLIETVNFKIAIFHYLRKIETISLIFMGLVIVKEKKQVTITLFLWSLVSAIVCFYAFGQKYFHFPVISTINSELSKGLVYYLGDFDRVSSTFSGHYDLAVFLVMGLSLLPAVIFYLIDNKKIKNIFSIKESFPFWWMIVIFIFSSVVLIMTAARLSFVAAVIGVFLPLLLLRKKKIIFVGILLCILFLIYPSQLRDRLVSTVKINILRNWDKYKSVSTEQEVRSKLNIPTLPATGKRIDTVGADAADIVPGEPVNNIELAVYRSLEIRTKVEWPRALRGFRKNPILGTGFSSLGLATDNDFLRLLGEVGILGTIAFLLILIDVFKRLLLMLKEDDRFLKYIAIGTLSLMIAFLVNSLFIDVFEASKISFIFWLFIGMVLGLQKNIRKYENNG